MQVPDVIEWIVCAFDSTVEASVAMDVVLVFTSTSAG